MRKYQFFFATPRLNGEIFVDSRYKTPVIDIDTPAHARELTIDLATLLRCTCTCFCVNDKGRRSYYYEYLIDENE